MTEKSLCLRNSAKPSSICLSGAALALALAFSPMSALSAGYTVDTSGTAMTGLWWNQSESGWGTAVTHQYGMIFATIYTYDASRKPVWYFASSCPVTANGCSGTLYSAKGGVPATSAWSGAGLAVTAVGTVNLAFTDANTGTMSYTFFDGGSGSKAITRQEFASGTTPSTADYSGNWWNANESGWGMALARQANMNFATIYTYDSSGNPTWYFASSCPVVGTGCTGSLYSVTGGAPLTSAWAGSSLTVTDVGTLNLSFSNASTGNMSYTLKGANGAKAITRQVFATPPASGEICSAASAPAGVNYSQSGNTVTVTTNGCIPMPTTSTMCTPPSSQATGINVLTSTVNPSAKLSGITFNFPGLSAQFEEAIASSANLKTCTSNAPATFSSATINFDVCYDITSSEIAAMIPALQASGMVTVNPPITVSAKGTTTMQVVSGTCESTGAEMIYDALTGKTSIKQSDGSYKAVN